MRKLLISKDTLTEEPEHLTLYVCSLFSTLPASFVSGAVKDISVYRYNTMSNVSLLSGENSFPNRLLHRPEHFYKLPPHKGTF